MCPMLQTRKRSLERSHDPRITTHDRDPRAGLRALPQGTCPRSWYTPEVPRGRLGWEPGPCRHAGLPWDSRGPALSLTPERVWRAASVPSDGHEETNNQAVVPDYMCALPGMVRGLSGEREAQGVGSSPAQGGPRHPSSSPATDPGL